MNWRAAGWAAAGVLPFLALLWFGLGRDPSEIRSPLPGRAAPTFALEVMAAEDAAAGVPDTIRSEDLAGQVVVVNFWASWCLPCRAEHGALADVARTYEGKGVQFMGVLYKDSPANALRWLEELGGQVYPTVLDPGARAAIDFGLYGVPETFFIGPDGRVGAKYVGPVTESILIRNIEALLAPAAAAP